MDHPASDRSDRQLRPRALCLRCKRLESLCACKKQRQRIAATTRSRTSQVTGPEVTEEPAATSKGLVTRGRAGTATQPPAPSAGVGGGTSTEELMSLEAPAPSTSMQLRPHSTTSWYSNLLLEALGKTSSESSVTTSNNSSSSSSTSSSHGSGRVQQEGEEEDTSVDQPSTPQPSTSQHVPITETPKRANVEMVPRRIFPGPRGKSRAARKPPPDVSTPPDAPKRRKAAGGGARPPSVPSTSRGSSRKGHVCPECGKAFGSPGKLSQHMFSHTGERPFPCTQCSKAFSSKFKLVRHNLIHSTVRRFVCGTCGRQFHRKDHLQNHAKIHAAVKLKFRCDRVGCNKEYTSANSARKHSAAHAAQDGQLDCTLCGRQFATTPEVLHHLKVHAGSRAVKTQADRKFTCEVCGRSFFTRKDVRRHFVVHTGLRDFLCQFCPQRFGRKDHLVRHIKKSHQSGWTKIRRKTRRVVSNPSPSETRDAGSSPGPSSARDPSPVTVELKQEPEELKFVEVKQEVAPPAPQDLQTIPLELAAEIPLYPPPPYPKPPDEVLGEPYHKPPEDLSQFYSIVPDIQRLFTTESGNGQLLMSIMESVELSTTNREPDMLPSTSQTLPPSLEMMGGALAEQQMVGGGDLCDLVSPDPVASARTAMETLLRGEGDKNSAPLPRFDQAFPPQ